MAEAVCLVFSSSTSDEHNAANSNSFQDISYLCHCKIVVKQIRKSLILSIKQDRTCTYNITLRPVRATTVAVEKQ